MINLLLGQPGGGKSYEAVAFHILPNLEDGRRVITNLPLNLENIHSAVLGSNKLLSCRLERIPVYSGEDVETYRNDFEQASDFDDPWRDEATGRGPLYVIDECHKMYPRVGCDKKVLEFFAEHRHAGIDILLITQAYGKLSPDLRDMVQMVYRVKKMTAFGKSTSYIRKVQDGIRGEVMSTSEREYDSKYFQFYKSHTASGSAVLEADAKDHSPSYLKWKRASYFLILGSLAYMAFLLFWPKSHAEEVKKLQLVTQTKAAIPDLTNITPPAVEMPVMDKKVVSASPVQVVKNHPFNGLTIHISGLLTAGQRHLYSFVIAQNGMPVASQSSEELKTAGYTVDYVSDCIAKITYPDVSPFYARCDLPKQAPVPESA
nr:zonular occludens toxin domain-containing protein [uncultured Deefgea sp.]